MVGACTRMLFVRSSLKWLGAKMQMRYYFKDKRNICKSKRFAAKHLPADGVPCATTLLGYRSSVPNLGYYYVLYHFPRTR